MSKRITITLTDEEYNQIKEDAERNYRTFNEELRYKLKLLRAGGSDTPTSSPSLHYPPGVRSVENPEGRPIITSEHTNDYNSYYQPTETRRRTVIG